MREKNGWAYHAPCLLALAACSCAPDSPAPENALMADSAASLHPFEVQALHPKLVSCDDGNPCTRDRRWVFWCAHSPAEAGLPCTTSSTCGAVGACNGAGACVPPIDVCDDANTCTSDRCLPASWAGWRCVHRPRGSGSACDDSNACTVSDACESGVCVGEALDTNDGDASRAIPGRQSEPAGARGHCRRSDRGAVGRMERFAARASPGARRCEGVVGVDADRASHADRRVGVRS